ncbi:MAG: hypothetical protein B5766_09220 [Candidatus Lumbricidophila eiseniae]|uniref:Uncharacterized protein n=1 Tax=Candidatus Lumbricidiphila eiseniae TaxID=1969409 RepID=A0A2A6FQI2_9MICO|nr:MAG: hypothetical protein B5766_09220 [Candidatus Lumbricidophila eiseniae]
MSKIKKALAQAREQANERGILAQVGYCHAGGTAGHYILIENHCGGAYTKGWWLWKRLITYEDGGNDINFSGGRRYDDNDWYDSYFEVPGEKISYFCQKSQVEFAPTENIRDIVILRLFENNLLSGPYTRPEQSLGRKSKNPAGRFQGSKGFQALATEIDASIAPDPEYTRKNKTTTITHLSETESVCKTIDSLTNILYIHYDYSFALRSNVVLSPSEKIGEMMIQDLPKRAKKFNYAWTPWEQGLLELLSEAEVQDTLTAIASALAAYGYYLTVRPLVLSPNIEDPWAEFR